MSRIATVGDGTNTATYTRKPGTNLLNTTTITAGGSTKLTTSRSYDNLYRLTSISSVSSVVKTYSYTYDDSDRRTKLNMADGSYWVYDYDANGQVISGVKHDADGKAIPGQSFGYAYDGIGNLTSEQRNVAAMNISYVSNNVNQYTSRTFPSIAPVVGEADTDVAIKAIRTDIRDPGYADTMIVPIRDGKYFSGMFRNIANSNAAVNVTYDVYAMKNDNANNQQLINKQSESFLVPKRDQSFTYDFDSNMLSTGVWNYTWNGENQLIVSINAANTVKQEYAYDFAGRRTYKNVYNYANGNWTQASGIKFVYQGRNLIAELDATTGSVLRTYLWGEDVSGSMQGAGGVGGLLAVTDSSGTYYPVYDGNGNIRAYTDASGAVVAEYEYDAFGKIIFQSGTKADDFVFRFSTKYYDKETGLYYYGYRYYSPDLRRWLNRDPMGELGGVNLYGFCFNNPNSYVDTDGRRPFTEPKRYFEDWKGFNPRRNRSLDEQYLKTLKRGCVGITALNLGYVGDDMPSTKNCYKKKAQAESRKKEMETKCECKGEMNVNQEAAKPRMFSIHLYDKGRDMNGKVIDNNSLMVEIDEKTGKADLSKWEKGNYAAKDDDSINYDYGWSEDQGRWFKKGVEVIFHANQADDPEGTMEVYRDRPENWEGMDIGNQFNLEVWCVECDNVKNKLQKK